MSVSRILFRVAKKCREVAENVEKSLGALCCLRQWIYSISIIVFLILYDLYVLFLLFLCYYFYYYYSITIYLSAFYSASSKRATFKTTFIIFKCIPHFINSHYINFIFYVVRISIFRFICMISKSDHNHLNQIKSS